MLHGVHATWRNHRQATHAEPMHDFGGERGHSSCLTVAGHTRNEEIEKERDLHSCPRSITVEGKLNIKSKIGQKFKHFKVNDI